MEIIAEIGWNHMGDMTLAEEMIIQAKKSGATTVKFQYWNPETLKKGSWDEDGRRQIYEKAVLDEKKIKFLIKISKENGCKFLISAFGSTGASFLKNLGLDSLKIPSHEIANQKLLSFCSINFSKVFLSAGAASSEEVTKAVETLEDGNCEYNLMHCVSSYPCPSENVNINRLKWLKTLHPNIGFSDHSQGTLAPAIAVLYGVSVIEKHFTIDKNLPGRDNKFALEPFEFEEMCKNILFTKNALIEHGNDFQDIELDTINNYRGRWEPKDYE